MTNTKLFTFWSGRPLGYVEHLCIASMLEAGHALDIFSHDPDLDVPLGVTLRDAGEMVGRDRVVAHQSGSLALFSDVFRYEALLSGAGIWVDLDVLVLKPLDGIGDHIFGWQDAYVINGAVFSIPSDSACLQRLINLCRSAVAIPPQWPAHRKIAQRLRALVGRQVPIQDMEWGAVGPLALTRLVADFRLFHRCQPADVFYPVPWQEAHLTFEPDPSAVLNALTSSTRAIHLWNDRIKELKRTPPPRGSFLAGMCERYGIDPISSGAQPG